MHRSPPTTLPVYSIEERLRYQVFFDTWKPFLKNVQVTQKATTNACMELWNSSNDLMKEFEMQPMLSIDEVTPTTTRIVEVEECKKIIQVSIQILTQIGKESLEEHLLRPSRLIIKIQQFVKITMKELQQEVSAKVCSGELIIERSQS
jgi:hypothetical protein